MKQESISRDKAFTDLIKPENLNKIKIDKELVPYFIEVMEKFQSLFEKKGWIKATNYALLFEKFLLKNDDNQFSIMIETDNEKLGVNVNGQYFKDEKKIVIKKKCLDENQKGNPSLIKSILAHEFIHFIAITDLPWIEDKNGNFIQDKNYFQDHIVNAGFFAEGFTQIITEMLYPNNLMYYPYTSMVKIYMNVFRDGNYFNFFRGRLPGKTYYSDKMEMFMSHAERFFHFAYDKNMSWEEEINQPYYQEAFNLLVDVFKEQILFEIERFDFATTQEFAQRIYDFNSLTIFKSKYFEDTVDLLITKFVSFYFRKTQLTEQFEIKENLTKLIFNEMMYLSEPDLKGVYQSKKDKEGFYFKTKNYKDIINLKIYSGEDVLIRNISIKKHEKLAVKLGISEVVTKNVKSLELFIKDNQLFISLYNKALDKLSKEQYENLPENKLPILYKIPLYEKENNKLLDVKQNAMQTFENMNSLIDNKDIALMKLIRDNKDVLFAYEISGVFDKESPHSLYFAPINNSENKFFYISGKYYKELKKVNSSLIKLSISNKESLFVSVKRVNKYLSDFDAVSFDENGRNHKKLDANLIYKSSKAYFDKITNEEIYKEYAENEEFEK